LRLVYFIAIPDYSSWNFIDAPTNCPISLAETNKCEFNIDAAANQLVPQKKNITKVLFIQ
jgi:hypothetical protein